jgi:hypothetical protein
VLQTAAAHGDTPEQTAAAKVAVRDKHLAGIKDEVRRRSKSGAFLDWRSVAYLRNT